MSTEYKLIQSVDPTKIKVNIKEKFAKLTLSSNKKKPIENTENLSTAVHKRVSRNLMDDMMDAEQNQEYYINPILRTDSSSHTSNNSLDMEPLLVSFSQPTYTQIEKDAESLSQQISNLKLNANNDEKVALKNEISITISSSSSYDSESAITISDSSSQNEYNDMITSDIPRSGETADAFLPSTLSNEKADRIIAFLRDVSQVRKELESKVNEIGNETFCSEVSNAHFLEVPTDNEAKNIARADTESMTHDFENKSNYMQDNMDPTYQPNFSLLSSNMDVIRKLKNKSFQNREMRLANDETVANTSISSLENSCNSISIHSPKQPKNVNHHLHISNEESFIKSSTYSEPPGSSITILETDSENESRVSHEEINKETALSTQSQHDHENVCSISQESDIQQSITSINITAKINIKISITQSNDEETGSNSSEDLQPDKILINTQSIDITSPRALTEDDGSSNNQRPSNLVEEINTNTTNKSYHSVDDDDDPNFIENAQKLLDQLYGNSWQTPDVLRTLNLTDKIKRAKQKQGDNITPDNKNMSIQKDESFLDDFSIFRREIKTNLDSTRTVDEATKASKRAVKIRSEERKKTAPKKIQQNIKTPRSDFKLKRKDTNYNKRWRHLVDDSDGASDNASDDTQANKTHDKDFFSSDEFDLSWKKSNNSTSSSSCDSKSNKKGTRSKKHIRKKNTKELNEKLVFLDLSKDEVEIINGTPQTPQANYDEQFNKHLQHVLQSCKFEDRLKLTPAPNKSLKSKRKLFNPNFGNEDEQQTEQRAIDKLDNNEDVDEEKVKIKFQPLPANFEPLNKHLEAIKTGVPIFKIPSPKSTPRTKSRLPKTQTTQPDFKTPSKTAPGDVDACYTPSNKYGFLKSLDVCVAKSLCHPDALYYRDNFRVKKEELTKKLFDIYNEMLFKNELEVPIIWNKKLLNTAGRCLNKKRMGTRTSVVELSEKVLTSADRLRCTLIHELCHAATWIFNGEGGHGATWKYWANKANTVFPEIPKIGVCHQYDIEYKYTYKCTLCAAKSHAHSKSKKVENIRCSYCHGAIEVYLNKKDKDGNILPTPVREPKGFAKFVKEKYKAYKRPDLKHADVMKILSNEFAAMKVVGAN